MCRASSATTRPAQIAVLAVIAPANFQEPVVQPLVSVSVARHVLAACVQKSLNTLLVPRQPIAQRASVPLRALADIALVSYRALFVQ